MQASEGGLVVAATSPLDTPLDRVRVDIPNGPRQGFTLPRRVDPNLDDFAHGSTTAPADNVRPVRQLSMGEVKGIISREIQDSLGGLGSQVSEQQRMSIRMYYGKPIGNEIQGRSQVVLMDVLETIEWAMPSLMRMFTGGSAIARFLAKREDQTENAALATAYLNHVFLQEMDGEGILYDWFKTALMEKNGIVKVYWEEKTEPKIDSYTGVTEQELGAIMVQKDGSELIAMVERDSDTLVVPDPQTGQPMPVPVYDVEFRAMRTIKRIRIDGVPPEEFLIARREIKLDDETTFTAQHKKQTVSDLVAMGHPFDVVSIIPSDDSPEFSQGRTARLSEDETFPTTTAERSDPASREIWTTECYMKIDEDADGHAELRHILAVGSNAHTILEDEEINMNPFVSITPIPMPHKFHGLSLADLVVDLQIMRSTLLRMIMDHTYLAVQPRMAIVEGMVELDDLMTSRPGGLVRQRAPGQIEPILTPPLPPEAYKALEYLEETRNNRTGVMAHGQELDASAINTTATGMSAVMAEKQSKLELIARIFAGGIKKLFMKMLRLMVENDTKERQFRHNGKWVTINPSTWDADMDLEIEVGLGAGKAVERLANLGNIMGVQEKLITAGFGGYLVTPENLFESAAEMTEVSGYKDRERFFTNPVNRDPPEPEPNVELLTLEADKTAQQFKAAQAVEESKLAFLKEKGIQRHRSEELAMKERVEIARIESMERNALGNQDTNIRSSIIQADATTDAATIAANARTENAGGAAASA